MNEKDHKTALLLAQVSVCFGVLVCIALVVWALLG